MNQATQKRQGDDEDRVKSHVSDVIKNRGFWPPSLPEEVCHYISKLNSSFPTFCAT